MRPVTAIILSIIIWGTIGVVCTWWPTTVQRWAIRSQRGLAGRLNPFRGFIESDAYVPMVRVIGIVALAVALFALASLVFGIHGPAW